MSVNTNTLQLQPLIALLRRAQGGLWSKQKHDQEMEPWNKLAASIIQESQELEAEIRSEQGLEPDEDIEWNEVDDTPNVYIRYDGAFLDQCLSDYFRGYSQPYAQIALPWTGTGAELKQEVENECWEVWEADMKRITRRST